MKSLYVLFDRAIRAGHSYREAMAICQWADWQIRDTGRFRVEAAGGWIFGSLTPHGVVLGR